MHKDHKCITEITKTGILLDGHDIKDGKCTKCGLVIDSELYNKAVKQKEKL